jgi:hypothetical protein
MAKERIFKLKKEDIQELVTGMGGCLATDKITVDGEAVDYMYREEPANKADSGWCFFSGTEDQAYIDDVDNTAAYNVNTIANYDPAIIPYLRMPVGSKMERIAGTDQFQMITE